MGNIVDILLCNVISQDILLSHCVVPPLSNTCDHSIVSFKVKLKSKISLKASYSYHNFKHANY